jgi:hypothetical protein
MMTIKRYEAANMILQRLVDLAVEWGSCSASTVRQELTQRYEELLYVRDQLNLLAKEDKEGGL